MAPFGRTITLRTDRADFEARSVVFSAGPWLGSLFPEFAKNLQVYRQLVFWFGFDDRESFEKYSSSPVFVWDSPEGLLYGFPPVEGQAEGLKIATEQYRIPTVPGSPHKGFIEEQRTYDDFHPAHENIIVASPCSGHGFKASAAVGEILADLATTGGTSYDIGGFTLDRFDR